MTHTEQQPILPGNASPEAGVSLTRTAETSSPIASIPTYAYPPAETVCQSTQGTPITMVAPRPITPKPYNRREGRQPPSRVGTNEMIADRILEDLIDLSARSTGLTAADVAGRCRRTSYTDARKIVAVLARRIAPSGAGDVPIPLTHLRIGKALGDRDHTTMIHLEKAGLILLHSTTQLPRVRQIQDRMSWVLRHLRRLGYRVDDAEGWHVDHMATIMDPTFTPATGASVGRVEADNHPVEEALGDVG